jgi:hypothetical protein
MSLAASTTRRFVLLQVCPAIERVKTVSFRGRRWKSSGTTEVAATFSGRTATAASASAGGTTAAQKSRMVLEAERQAYLRDANEQMKLYHDTRERMRRGELTNINAHLAPSHAGKAQAAVAVVFLALFIATPFLGRRIARDDEFRERWIPKWYDYTVQKPENSWTRDELHEQFLMVQMHLRERAIKGDFAPEKLDKLQSHLEAQDQQKGEESAPSGKSRQLKVWDTFAPGMSKDEEYNES